MYYFHTNNSKQAPGVKVLRAQTTSDAASTLAAQTYLDSYHN
jgi:hypothetical protein